MDRVTHYRKIICEFLESFTHTDPQAQLVFDPVRDRYLPMHNEWRGESRIYGCAMQLDLINEQVWIQHNSTEIFIDRELSQRGIPQKDIIFGFRSPSVRKYLAAALENN